MPGKTRLDDSSSYVPNHHKTHFGTTCGASLLICPHIQLHGCMQWRLTNYGLFLIDVCDSDGM